MSATLGCKDKGIRKSEFVAKSQFLSIDSNFLRVNDTFRYCSMFI